MLLEKGLTLLPRADKALGRSCRWVGVSYCHTYRICVIPILISFIVEFKAVSTGRTQCFAVAAKICGDRAIWLGTLVVSTQQILCQQRCLSKSLHCRSCVQASGVVYPVPLGYVCRSALLREGEQVAAWEAASAVLPQGHRGHSQPKVQGGTGHLLRPLPRTHQMSLCLAGGCLSR